MDTYFGPTNTVTMSPQDSPSHDFLQVIRTAASRGDLRTISTAYRFRYLQPRPTAFARGRLPAILLHRYFPNRDDLDQGRFRAWSQTHAWSEVADSLKKRVPDYPKFVACIEHIVARANGYDPSARTVMGR